MLIDGRMAQQPNQGIKRNNASSLVRLFILITLHVTSQNSVNVLKNILIYHHLTCYLLLNKETVLRF